MHLEIFKYLKDSALSLLTSPFHYPSVYNLIDKNYRQYIHFNMRSHVLFCIKYHQWWWLYYSSTIFSQTRWKEKKKKEKREFWIVCNREIDIIVERNRNAFRVVIRLWSTKIVSSRAFPSLKDGRKGGEQKESESNSSQKTLIGPSNGDSRVLFLVELKSSVIILGSDVLKREAFHLDLG